MTDGTRAKLLEAAFREVYARGFQAASLTEILRDTGLTKGALYHHFSCKRTLGLAVVEEAIRERLETNVFRPLEEAERPVRTLLEMWDDKLRFLDDDTIKHGCPLNNLIQEMSPMDVEFRARLGAILTRWQEVLGRALRRGQAQHDIRADIDCDVTALFILAAWEGCWGIAKSQQSASAFRLCLARLQDYVRGLCPADS